MASFEDREKGFERKFAHDEELKFKATARRNRLLGLWAAELMGISGDAAQAYAREVIKADLEEPGEEDVFRKISADFDAKGVGKSDHQISRKMADLMVQAVSQIEVEGKGCAASCVRTASARRQKTAARCSTPGSPSTILFSSN